VNFISIDLIIIKKKSYDIPRCIGAKIRRKKWKRYWEKINECDKWGHEMIEKEMEWKWDDRESGCTNSIFLKMSNHNNHKVSTIFVIYTNK